MIKSVLFDYLDAYGADMSGINSRFRGNGDLYGRFFFDFLTEHEFEALNQAIHTENYEEAFENAHTLKGLSGNLGLTPLYNALSVLVETLRKKEYNNIKMEFAEVEKQLQRLMKLAADVKAGQEN